MVMVAFALVNNDNNNNNNHLRISRITRTNDYFLITVPLYTICRGCLFFSLSLFYFFTLFYFTILYWFCHTSTWILHRCTCVPNPEPPYRLSGSSQCTNPKHPVSCIEPRLAIRFLYEFFSYSFRDPLKEIPVPFWEAAILTFSSELPKAGNHLWTMLTNC